MKSSFYSLHKRLLAISKTFAPPLAPGEVAINNIGFSKNLSIYSRAPVKIFLKAAE
jgi:hypothetical protein